MSSPVLNAIGLNMATMMKYQAYEQAFGAMDQLRASTNSVGTGGLNGPRVQSANTNMVHAPTSAGYASNARQLGALEAQAQLNLMNARAAELMQASIVQNADDYNRLRRAQIAQGYGLF